ncbi:MAG: hypothetical protein WBF99_12140 [Xanthobacteraceae bacterium]
MLKWIVVAGALASMTAAAQAQETRGFDGYYAGITAKYDVPPEKTGIGQYLTTFPYQFNYYVPYPRAPGASLEGAGVGALTGFNNVSGSLLVGIEARALYNFSRTSSSLTINRPGQTPPFATAGGWCPSCDSDPFTARADPTSYLISDSSTQTFRRTRSWQIDVTPRLGLIVNDWLFFAKAGFGLEETKRINTNDNSATAICVQPIVEHRQPAPHTFEIAVVGCQPGGVVRRGPVTTTLASMITPIAILGLGIERNFGSYFARVETEMTAHIVTGDTYYTPSANFTIGYRF